MALCVVFLSSLEPVLALADSASAIFGHQTSLPGSLDADKDGRVTDKELGKWEPENDFAQRLGQCWLRQIMLDTVMIRTCQR